ncbi:hypothetical protein L0337_25970 [candidate division KSB1 bacterium]|nr:hypothetical protein [candidate division KSB1 bacterium]
MIDPGLYRLKHVDYSQRGDVVSIIVDGIVKPQTVIFSGVDYIGERYYFTEEGLRYISDSRHKRIEQDFILKHLSKIPTVLKSPLIVARHHKISNNYLFLKDAQLPGPSRKKILLLVVLKKSNINVVWNYLWQEENKVPKDSEVIFRSRSAKRYLR